MGHTLHSCFPKARECFVLLLGPRGYAVMPEFCPPSPNMLHPITRGLCIVDQKILIRVEEAYMILLQSLYGMVLDVFLSSSPCSVFSSLIAFLAGAQGES